MKRGAGILFVKKEAGKVYISLGKRTIQPQEGYWSIPGGAMSKIDNNNFFACALRETKEEYFRNTDAESFDAIQKLKPSGRSRIIIPFFFEFHTYLLDITNISVHFRNNWEFSDIGWFDAGDLPAKTHFGVKYSLMVFHLF